MSEQSDKDMGHVWGMGWEDSETHHPGFAKEILELYGDRK